ncbi:3-mercaptopyruvate sulfurtransferase [Paracoccus tibetensis]|uniref:3-mercaptopyruvate sulfurtransferase n=1 Tax=Paracoccus tibetensis TaxID=336292 RepID=A0A1G5IRS2_9RHOB|nr:3-mercaptopyruvate sulfurtransferase [Paracoccus tibetensis]SCY78782.1 thiosulfate/3-mercaptopyruvate sulfurtransferase [Paracoccus tibetensis]
MTDDPEVLVGTDWLAARLNDPDLRILDASWHMPASGRDARAEHRAAHIPGARFFDIDAISDTRSALPHMAPTAEHFTAAVRALGIGDGQQVVIYDDSDVRSAARAWWTFRLMGIRRASVLDGGLAKWRAEGRPLDDAAPQIRDRHLTATRQPALVRDVTQVAEAAKLGAASIVDARAAARFRGEAPEPRSGLRSGHIPGSRNLPFGQLFAEDGTLLRPDQLRAAFQAAGVDLDRPVITTCGSGVTAAVLSLALARIGHRDNALYDGSWTEWGSFPDLNIATGDA